VASSDDEPSSFDPPSVSLRHQPQRPGELTELIDVPLDATAAARTRAAAVEAGLPLELALYIAIEAERAVSEAVEVTGVERAELVARLDAAAAVTPERGLGHTLVRPLEQYAAAVARGLPDDDAAGRAVRARVPHHVACAWAHAAAAVGKPFDSWVADTLARASGDRKPWEAAAARAARTLAEWVLVQAASFARSRSTSPQTTASG
jgi:hypothetical protein